MVCKCQREAYGGTLGEHFCRECIWEDAAAGDWSLPLFCPLEVPLEVHHQDPLWSLLSSSMSSTICSEGEEAEYLLLCEPPPLQGWAILSLVYRISYSRIIWQISYIGDIKAISWYFIRYFWSNSPITLESWGNKTKQTVLEFLTPTNKFKKK